MCVCPWARQLVASVPRRTDRSLCNGWHGATAMRASWHRATAGQRQVAPQTRSHRRSPLVTGRRADAFASPSGHDRSRSLAEPSCDNGIYGTSPMLLCSARIYSESLPTRLSSETEHGGLAQRSCTHYVQTCHTVRYYMVERILYYMCIYTICDSPPVLSSHLKWSEAADLTIALADLA